MFQRGSTYRCRKTVRLHGVEWFTAGARYQVLGCREGREGELEVTFKNLRTGEVFAYRNGDSLAASGTEVQHILACLEPA